MDMTAKTGPALKDAEQVQNLTFRKDAQEADTAIPGIGDDLIEMAREKGVIVFRAKTLGEAEIASVADTRERIGPDAPLIAITGANTSLTDARKLTRAGVSEVVPDTITAEEFGDLLNDLTRAPVRAVGGQRRGGLIAVTRSRGGVGATTVAVNLADALLERRGHFKKTSRNTVALVDFDLQLGDVASFLDVEPNDALYELAVTGKTPDETYVRHALTTLPSGLSVLTAPTRFAPLDALTPEQVSAIVEILRRTHDYVVLDLPSGLSRWMDPIIEHADQALMVTDCAVPSIRQARRLIDFFSETNPALKIEVVVNHEAKPVLLRRHQAAAEKVLDRKFRHLGPRRSTCGAGGARSRCSAVGDLSQIAPFEGHRASCTRPDHRHRPEQRRVRRCGALRKTSNVQAVHQTPRGRRQERRGPQCRQFAGCRGDSPGETRGRSD
jgi:pilus assembly protein CpaE